MTKSIFVTALVLLLCTPFFAAPSNDVWAQEVQRVFPSQKVSDSVLLNRTGAVHSEGMGSTRIQGVPGHASNAHATRRNEGNPVYNPKVLKSPTDHPDDICWSSSPLNGPSPFDDQVARMTFYDGKLVAVTAGNTPVTQIAAWDGSSWSQLGTGFVGEVWSDASITALIVFGDQLIAAGGFEEVGGVTAGNIAVWNGSSWAPLGSGLDGDVSALTIYDDKLIAGGDFTSAGGIAVNGIAAWDGNSWSSLDQGISDDLITSVGALAVYGNLLVVGGQFETGGSPNTIIVSWDGTSWLPLGTGIPAGYNVHALAIYEGNLIAAGSFPEAGGDSVGSIASWDGSGWSALGAGIGVDGYIEDVIVFDGKLVACGSFVEAGGVAANNLAIWDGVSWSAMGSGADGEVVYDLAIYDNQLLACGDFNAIQENSGVNIARWDGADWKSFSAATRFAVENWVYSLAEYQGRLFVGCEIPQKDEYSGCLLSWDDSTWTCEVTGVTGCYALTGFQDQLVAGGAFDGSNVLIRSGNSWAPLDFPFRVLALTEYDGKLIVGGWDYYSGAVLRSWDGSTWSNLGQGLIGNEVSALTVFDDKLIVAGWISEANGIVLNNIASWDGLNWSALSTGMSDRVLALAVYDGQLVAGGMFTVAGGVSTGHVAAWSGLSWTPIGAGPSFGDVEALSVHDSKLFVGGWGGIESWNGTNWEQLGSGVDGIVYALQGSSKELVVGGSFQSAGGKPASNIARWTKLTTSTGEISGAVVHDETGDSVPSAEVLLYYDLSQIAQTATDDEGNFSFSGLCSGIYRVSAWKAGYAVATLENVVVTDGQQTDVTIQLQPALTAPVPYEIVRIPSPIGSFQINWSLVSDCDGYELEWANNSQFIPIVGSHINTSASETSHSVSCLGEGTWYFRVRTLKSGNSPSDWSSVESGTVDFTQSMPFSVNPNGWSFPNWADYVWPETWWDQFHYYDNESLYSRSAKRWFENNYVDEEFFPDWQLYAQKVGPGCCNSGNYYNPKTSYLEEWLSFVESQGFYWGGSCVGFAITSLFFFDNVFTVSSEYPGHSTLYSVPNNEAGTPDPNFYEINKYWLSQFSSPRMQYLLQQYLTVDPSQAVTQLARLFNRSDRTRDQFLNLRDQLGSDYWHAVVPISLTYEGCATNIVHIAVYDNSFDPPTQLQQVTVNLNSNTWSYTTVDGEVVGGSRGLFLSEEIDEYIEEGGYKKNLNDRAASDVRLYTSSSNGDIVVKLSDGDSLGYANGEVILPANLDVAVPVIPFSESRAFPTAYFLDAQPFGVQISEVDSGGYTVSAFTDSTMLRVKREALPSDGSDYLGCDPTNRSIIVQNNSAVTGKYRLETLSGLQDLELGFTLQNLKVQPTDSLNLQLLDSATIRLQNFGDSTDYDIVIEAITSESDSTFTHYSIPLTQGSSQEVEVTVTGGAIGEVLIYIDNENDGVFDDTLMIANQPSYECGDINISGRVDITDAVYLINYIFASGPDPQPEASAADFNCSNRVDISDAVYLINYIFASGPAPCAACK